MAIGDQVRFIYQNTNGVKYDVVFEYSTGVGYGQKRTSFKDGPAHAVTKTAVTVDAGSLTAWKTWHNSRRIYSAVYNTTTALSSILNAAS